MIRLTFLPMLALVLGLAATVSRAPAQEGPDQERIRQVMLAIWDRPEAPLVVEPVVISGGHALASWAQGDRGGRALLRHKDGAWTIVLCSGDPLKEAETLRQIGIPARHAAALAKALSRAEAGLPPEQRVKFSRFDGMVRMDESPEPGK